MRLSTAITLSLLVGTIYFLFGNFSVAQDAEQACGVVSLRELPEA
jgi:hypothetical protein